MKLLLAADIPDWQSRDASRRDQYFRTNLGKTLKLIVDRIVNAGALDGTYVIDGGGTVHFKFEDAPVATIAEPADDAAA